MELLHSFTTNPSTLQGFLFAEFVSLVSLNLCGNISQQSNPILPQVFIGCDKILSATFEGKVTCLCPLYF